MMQLTLDAAIAEREEALNLVELNNAGFVQTMRTLARQVAQRKGSVTSDDLRVLADQYGLVPDHRNSWGAIFHTKDWRLLDRRKSVIVSNRAREIKVWGLR